MDNPSYFHAYKNLAMSRDENGVLTVRFHTGGDPIVFTEQTHEDLRAPASARSSSRRTGRRSAPRA
jgi:hypothetical protein